MNPLDLFIDTLNVTLPVFAMVLLGMALKKIRLIDHAFIDTGSNLVFKGAMPTLIFLSIVDADFSRAFDPSLVIYFSLATVTSFFGVWAVAARLVVREDRGVFVQGAFRGNCGIVGLALAGSMYGQEGLSAGGIMAGAAIIIYNVLSVIVLAAYQPGIDISARSLAIKIIKNPLIIAVISALIFSKAGVTLPVWLHTSGDYFARMTLPLALICIGGTLSVGSLTRASTVALQASFFKMIAIPALAILGAIALGFRGQLLGILFLYLASPSASSSFVMAKAMGGNHTLAANIIALTTLATGVVITAGVFIMMWLGLV
ncbi:AEC family transporter [Larsenimonas salina]|uniref:AEC family transporter n=1 Tax=Larsenimonas salina TaxID=1295565 RepID=UPI0020745BD4|nr:AEC family transporter [Larsenimonas salina]MCM5703558.1 AEC family transporter [Larsenimonas salina]